MYCVHCGKEISDGSAYCVHCGKPQGARVPTEAPFPVQAAGAAPSPYVHPVQMPRKKKGMLPLILGASAGGAVLLAALIFVFVQFILPAVSGGKEPPVSGGTESGLGVPGISVPAESGTENDWLPDEGQAEPSEEPIQMEAGVSEGEPLEAMEPIVIQEGETAEYDLDGDGQNEQIFLAVEETEDGYYLEYTLYLNGTPLQLEGSSGYAAELWIVDIDVTDNQKELCFSTSGDSDCLGAYSIVTWRNGAPLVLADLKMLPIMMGRGSVYRKATQVFPGDGTFTVFADTPVYNPAFGCLYVGIPYAYDGTAVTVMETQTYNLRVDSALAPYYAAYTPFIAYLSPGGDTEAFAATVGTVYMPDQLALVGGVLYLHVSSEDGTESGWISEKGEMNAYYEMPPAWG